MSKKKALKKYHELFGADAPVPPDQLLPVIISMIESGEMERVLDEHGDEINKLSDELGDAKLDKNDPIWKPIKPDERHSEGSDS